MKLSLHPAQRQMLECDSPISVTVSGRSLGKSHGLRAIALYKALSYPTRLYSDRRATKLCPIVMATSVQCSLLHWLPLLRIVEGSKWVEDINHSTKTIRFIGNRPSIILKGADRQGERLRGIDPVWVGIDEAQDVPVSVWDEILYPALVRNRQWSASLIGTPDGQGSPFHLFTQRLQEDYGAQYFHFSSWDNPFVDRAELERAKRVLPKRIYDQEIMALWTSIQGAVFSEFGEHLVSTEPKGTLVSEYLTLDHGETNPALIRFGLYLDDQDQPFLYVDQEWINKTKLAVTQAEFFERLRQYGTTRTYRTFAPDDRPSTVLALRDYGRLKGVKCLEQTVIVLRNNPSPSARVNILNSLCKTGSILFHPRVERLLTDIRTARYVQDKHGNLEDKLDKGEGNHALDALLYGVAYLCVTEKLLRPLIYLGE